ncbi:hypothetical protein [Methylocystis parvus]|uniref:hypothetical protein n=1 Tax=Methylocystis parvus TaxID=134 RepID=UPI003C79408D
MDGSLLPPEARKQLDKLIIVSNARLCPIISFFGRPRKNPMAGDAHIVLPEAAAQHILTRSAEPGQPSRPEVLYRQIGAPAEAVDARLAREHPGLDIFRLCRPTSEAREKAMRREMEAEPNRGVSWVFSISPRKIVARTAGYLLKPVLRGTIWHSNWQHPIVSSGRIFRARSFPHGRTRLAYKSCRFWRRRAGRR